MRYNLFLFLILVQLPSLDSYAVPVRTQRMIISALNEAAIKEAENVILQGGNVVDVAVATALNIGVTSPYYASLGGGGFAMISLGKEVMAIDFREVAPKATSQQFFVDKPKNASLVGGAAVAVPGIPAGLWEIHRKYGKLPWAQLFSGAIKLAQKGFRVSAEWNEETLEAKEIFTNSAKARFFNDKGNPYLPADLFVQPDLAKLLLKFQEMGPKGFYEGEVADDLVNSIKNAGGVISHSDLTSYKVRWLKPMETTFQGYQLFLMPPPSSGGVVMTTALKLAEKLQLSKINPLSGKELHLWGSLLSRAFQGRSELGDPDFHKNPLSRILSPAMIEQLYQSINPDRATASTKPQKKIIKEGDNTTHLSVMDNDGNAVAMTLTLNMGYGSGVVTEQFGLALNNEMDDFTTIPGKPNAFGLVQGSGNNVEPGKRPLSSMSPTIIKKGEKAIMALGAAGGPRIISGVIQTLYRVLVNGFDMDQAIQARRVHHQFNPPKLFLDPIQFDSDTIGGLKNRGHTVTQNEAIGRVMGVRLTEAGQLEGAYDSRGDGYVGGY